MSDVNNILTKEEMEKSLCIIQTDEFTECAEIISQNLSACDYSAEGSFITFMCHDAKISVHIKLETIRKILLRLSNYNIGVEESNIAN